MHPFRPRPIRYHDLHRVGEWQLKLYSVRFGPEPVDWAAFAPGLALAEAALPQPASAPGRDGVGFLIAHQGRTGNYTVLGWWDRENELPLRVFVSTDRLPGSWRSCEGSESICVWDIEILWAERESYVASVLTPGGGGARAYLADFVGEAGEVVR